MKQFDKCLCCYGLLKKNELNYHQPCSRKLFNRPETPILPYAYGELNELAKNIIRSRVTVPGVQAKISLNLGKPEKGESRFTLVGLWGNFILKPHVPEYPEMPEIENLTMNLASLFKIDTVPHGLIPLKTGELAFITQRVDRLKGGEKRHMEDMCQLTMRLTEDKYHGSMEQIGNIIKQYASNPLLDCLRFFDVALFSFLTGNADMHLKNFSLLYPVNEMIHLSPAYDLLSTRLLISEKDDPDEMALTLNGKKRKLKMIDFKAFAKHLGINEKQFQNTLNRFSKATPLSLAVIDDAILSSTKKNEFKALVTGRAKRLGLVGEKRIKS